MTSWVLSQQCSSHLQGLSSNTEHALRGSSAPSGRSFDQPPEQQVPTTHTRGEPTEAAGTVAPAHERDAIIFFFLFPFISRFHLEMWAYHALTGLHHAFFFLGCKGRPPSPVLRVTFVCTHARTIVQLCVCLNICVCLGGGVLCEHLCP